MDVNNNTYTFSFAIIMVIIVSAILSYAAIQLKPHQDRNIELEKKQNILSSIGILVDREKSEEVYSKFITSELLLNFKGEEIQGDAFNLDLAAELKKDYKNQSLPLFISSIDGSNKYIIPLRGKGLWGPIWGFIALEDDLNTVFGAVFDHKAETPGLGAEINRDFFQDPFKGKNIFDNEGQFTSILVKKGGADQEDLHAVDAISGGTITSDGVTDMLYERLNIYMSYFNRIKLEIREREINLDSINILNDSIITYE